MESSCTGPWQESGLGLESHVGLLGVLSEASKSIDLSQKSRPAGMGSFDFVTSEVHGLRIKEIHDAQQAGRNVVGETICDGRPLRARQGGPSTCGIGRGVRMRPPDQQTMRRNRHD